MPRPRVVFLGTGGALNPERRYSSARTEWSGRSRGRGACVLVRAAGFEPASPFGQCLLRASRFPVSPRPRSRESWRRRADSNRRITDLQSAALPLGYGAVPGLARAFSHSYTPLANAGCVAAAPCVDSALISAGFDEIPCRAKARIRRAGGPFRQRPLPRLPAALRDHRLLGLRRRVVVDASRVRLAPRNRRRTRRAIHARLATHRRSPATLRLFGGRNRTGRTPRSPLRIGKFGWGAARRNPTPELLAHLQV